MIYQQPSFWHYVDNASKFLVDKTTIIIAYILPAVVKHDKIYIIGRVRVVGGRNHYELLENEIVYHRFCDGESLELQDNEFRIQ